MVLKREIAAKEDTRATGVSSDYQLFDSNYINITYHIYLIRTGGPGTLTVKVSAFD